MVRVGRSYPRGTRSGRSYQRGRVGRSYPRGKIVSPISTPPLSMSTENEEARRSRKDCFTSLDAAVVYVDREKEEARRVVRVRRSYPRGKRKRRDGSIHCVREG